MLYLPTQASTSGRDHATAADAAPTAIISTPYSSYKDAIINATSITTLPVGDDGAALITLQPAPDPDKTPNNANKAGLASLLAPPAGYVPLTPEERAAAREAGRLAREAEKREMDERMAAADAKARAAAQDGESFFGDMPGLGVSEELGGEEEDEEDNGMQLEVRGWCGWGRRRGQPVCVGVRWDGPSGGSGHRAGEEQVLCVSHHVQWQHIGCKHLPHMTHMHAANSAPSWHNLHTTMSMTHFSVPPWRAHTHMDMPLLLPSPPCCRRRKRRT
jgi:hypothetical protein